MKCMNNVKQIVLAFHSFHDANGALPPECVFDTANQTSDGWRYPDQGVSYIEQVNVYDNVDFSKNYEENEGDENYDGVEDLPR